jgi:hypothetical protein
MRKKDNKLILKDKVYFLAILLIFAVLLCDFKKHIKSKLKNAGKRIKT